MITITAGDLRNAIDGLADDAVLHMDISRTTENSDAPTGIMLTTFDENVGDEVMVLIVTE